MEWRAFPAMGTTVSVLAERPSTVERVQTRFKDLESRLSRFRESSELQRVNRHPAPEVSLSDTLAEALRVADELRRRTGGLVDAAVGRTVRAWGYDRTFGEVTDLPAEPDTPLDGDRCWEIEGATLRRPPGVILDLGGVAKGWAADLTVSETGAWAVNAGGDLCSRHPELTARIVDPWDEEPIEVEVGVGGLATSCTTRRAWRAGSARAHHLIDPRTGRPSDSPVIQATCLAATAAEAEAAAKAVILHGSEGLRWASGQGWIRSGLAVWEDGWMFATANLEVAA